MVFLQLDWDYGVFGKNTTEVKCLEHYFSPKTELWSLVQGGVSQFLPC